MATTVRSKDRAPGSRPIAEVKPARSTAIYGRSGSGKTTLASTWPKPILYLNIKDEGTDSIADVEGIDVVDINSSDDMLEIILWCVKKANRGKLKYKTIIFDTMTQFQGMLVREKIAEAGKKLKKGQNPGDFGTLTQQEWGQIAGEMKKLIMDARGIPDIESVFICQERIFNAGDEEDDGADQIDPEVGPRLSPSVKDDLNASVSIIGNTFIRIKVTTKKDKKTLKKTKKIEKQYCLRVGPNAVYTTKIRKPKGIEAPDFIIDPTFRKIKKIVKGIEDDG